MQSPQTKHSRRSPIERDNSPLQLTEGELIGLIERALDERDRMKGGWVKTNVGSLLTVAVLAATIVATNARLVERVDNLILRFNEFRSETVEWRKSIDSKGK